MDTVNRQRRTIISRLSTFTARHRAQAATVGAVIVILTFIVGQVFSTVTQYVVKSGIIQYITLLVALDLANTVFRRQEASATYFAENQDESLPRLLEAVRLCRTDGVDLIEYAGATTLPLIREIKREGVPMRLLVKHPDTVSGLQRQRMITALDTMFNSIFEGYKGQFEIRCYRLPFSLRGRRLGREVLELGWLTPDLKRQTAYGHSNPSAIVDLSTRRNDYLEAFFAKTFDEYWSSADTEAGRDVLARIQSEA